MDSTWWSCTKEASAWRYGTEEQPCKAISPSRALSHHQRWEGERKRVPRAKIIKPKLHIHTHIPGAWLSHPFPLYRVLLGPGSFLGGKNEGSAGRLFLHAADKQGRETEVSTWAVQEDERRTVSAGRRHQAALQAHWARCSRHGHLAPPRGRARVGT